MVNTILKDLFLLPLRGGDNEDSEEKKVVENEGNSTTPKADDSHDDDDDDELSAITDPAQLRIAQLSREAKKYRLERNRVRKELEDQRAAIEAEKTQGGSEKEKTQALLEAEQEKNKTLTETMSNIVLRNAVAEHKKYSWYDVPMVLSLIDRAKVDIDLEESIVDNLDSELKRIAKEKPYLVSKASGGSSEDENGSGGAGTKGSTGVNPSGKNMSTNAKAAQQAELISKYSSLRKLA